MGDGLLGKVQPQLPLCQTFLQIPGHQMDNLDNFIPGQRREEDRLINPIQELGAKMVLEGLKDLLRYRQV